MIIDDLVTDIVCDMAAVLDTEGIKQLKNRLYMRLSKYRIEREKCELTIYDDNNSCLVNKYIASRRLDGLADGSLSNYRLELISMLDRLGKKVKDITRTDIKCYFGYLKEVRKLAITTINTRRQYINGFFKWLVNEEILTKNPANGVNGLKEETILKDAFSTTEMEALRNACRSWRDRAIIEFLYGTGVRISEMYQLKREDIDFYTNEIRVLGKGRKWRKVYMSDKAVYYLKLYLNSRKDDNEFLFVTKGQKHIEQLSRPAVRHMLNDLSKRTGVKKVHPHRFRRTFATVLFKLGMRLEYIKELMGHVKVDTTLIYTRIDDTMVKAEYMQMTA